jgi:hypothetical protein
MTALLSRLKTAYPAVTFQASDQFRWSPAEQTVCYDPAKETPEAAMALLHELSHALLGHSDYKTDFELLQLEVAAWHHAEGLASEHSVSIDPDHIQDCLDTYRDWLHARSKCPSCTEHGLQKNRTTYTCLNCRAEWHVTSERFCRPYRRLKASQTDSK